MPGIARKEVKDVPYYFAKFVEDRVELSVKRMFKAVQLPGSAGVWTGLLGE